MQEEYRSRIEKKKRILKIFLIGTPIIIVIGVIVLKIIGTGIFKLPECDIYKTTHLFCPGCGNTRAVYALLRGDILASLRFNPTIIGGAVLFILYYIEMIFSYFGKDVTLMPVSLKFWIPMIFIWLTFLIARNFIPYFYNFLEMNKYG